VADITVSVSSPGQISTWGQSTWGNGSWNVFNGVSLSSASVTVDAEIAIGWGGQAWNIGTWGDVASTGANLTGISLSSNIGSVEFAGATQGWGRPSWGTAAWGLFGTVLAGGQQLSTGIGTVVAEGLVEQGWGRGKWGNRAWGDTFSAQAQGQALTSSINAVSPSTSVSISVSGLDLLTITQGLNSIQIDSSIFVFVGEDAMTLSQGSQSLVQSTVESPATAGLLTGSVGNTIAGLKIGVDVTGIAASLTLGSINLVQSTVESVSGQALTSAVGAAGSLPQQLVGVTGLNLTSAVGSVVSTGTANIDVSGIGLTANIGSANVTAWAEIDPGVNNVWTEVDRAA
jgi:hypothetical protein